MIIITKAGTNDIQMIQSVANIAFPATYSEILSNEQITYMMEWMYSTDSLTRQMNEEGHIYYIAKEDNLPVGFVSIQQEGKDLFHLQKIYVLPDKQKKHIGSQLFKKAVQAIRELHPESSCVMELNVNRYNKALDFYKRMGMHIAREGDFPIGNNFFMNDYIMALEIQPQQ